ncbi:hypothetical protein [Streptomyces sp. 6N223]|uniref:hypothetical protein n=1 Tax=Streptomyces sp. 6N223 TaxID=3457412 RepID=UPI003FD3A6DF
MTHKKIGTSGVIASCCAVTRVGLVGCSDSRTEVQVILHGQQCLAEVPEYGPGLEEDGTRGQQARLVLSRKSELNTSENSGHHSYVDEPEAAVDAMERVASRGMRGMRERTALDGGDLTARPAEGGGFEVTPRLPIDEAI